MAYFFKCDDGEEYVVEAKSFAEAQERFAARFEAIGCGDDIPQIRSYCASFDGVPSVMRLSVVA